jgi:hypothetical protein
MWVAARAICEIVTMAEGKSYTDRGDEPLRALVQK